MSRALPSIFPPLGRDDFEVAILCALPVEAQCVHDVIDVVWDEFSYGRMRGDHNPYTLGAIGSQNVVLVYLPGIGTNAATSAVSQLTMSFRNIKLALVVGVCGGMPYNAINCEVVLLGDVIISKALIHYSIGRQYPRGFQRKTDILNSLGPPNHQILALQAKLGTQHYIRVLQGNTNTFLQDIQRKTPMTKHPGIENDILYASDYDHKHQLPRMCPECDDENMFCNAVIETSCEDLGCDPDQRISRRRLNDPLSIITEPRIHFGIMGSADTVMRSGRHRDILAQAEGIIGVEMEGAGVWPHVPSIVIKGVCDYADSHKRKGWQQYAAATAAACTKAFLMEWIPDRRRNLSDAFRQKVLLNLSTKGQFWEHLTLPCFDLYQLIWKGLAAQHGNYVALDDLVASLIVPRTISDTTDHDQSVLEGVISRNWELLLQASKRYTQTSTSSQSRVAKFPENLVISVLYMTHVNWEFPQERPDSLEEPGVTISKRRWRLLTRFNRWIPCACERKVGLTCGRLWNLVPANCISRPSVASNASMIANQNACLMLRLARATREERASQALSQALKVERSIYKQFNEPGQLPIWE